MYAHSGRRTPFTLIELLVVVAVIAILASMLLPALTKARGAAMRAECGNRLKQVNMSWQLYADENNGFLPSPLTFSWYRAVWVTTLVDGNYISGDRHRADGDWYGQPIMAYTMFMCPSWNRVVHGGQGQANVMMNQEVAGLEGTWSSWRPEGLERPSNISIVAESGANNYTTGNFAAHHLNYDRYTGAANTGFMGGMGKANRGNHDATNNLAFADGHVEVLHRNIFLQNGGMRFVGRSNSASYFHNYW